MLKKTALVIGTLLTSSCVSAQMLVHLNLATAGNTQQQSVIVEDNQLATCQLDDLLFEIKAHKQDRNVNTLIKIFRVSRSEKILVASPEFTTEIGAPASLALEKDGQAMDLTIVTVDI